MVATRQEFGAGRRANRAYEKVLQESSIARQAIDVRRLKILVPRITEITIALVIGEKHDNVRLFVTLRLVRERREADPWSTKTECKQENETGIHRATFVDCG